MINLNKMTPAAATRLLNSTPLGTVLGDRQLSRHLQRAGYRIAGDAKGKAVSLLKYVAWLVDERAAKIEKKKINSIPKWMKGLPHDPRRPLEIQPRLLHPPR